MNCHHIIAGNNSVPKLLQWKTEKGDEMMWPRVHKENANGQLLAVGFFNRLILGATLALDNKTLGAISPFSGFFASFLNQI